MATDADQGLGEDLFRHLAETLYAVKPADRWNRPCRWVMNAEWWNEARKLRNSAGHYLWWPSLRAGEPPLLMGWPVEVHDDGGVPHMELPA